MNILVSAALLLLIMGVYDGAVYRLPDFLTLPFLLLTAVFAPPEPDLRIAGMVLACSILWITASLFRRVRGFPGLGFGDVKLAAGCGALIGVQQVGLMLLLASSLALVILLDLAGSRRLADATVSWGQVAKRPIALGPFLAGSTLLIAYAQVKGLLS
ncbi:prepilin peptidase [Labrys monachus]|uniref:Prepilin signal peptidase PulO-like enzyme (Type II secretory pathway) n=1 Tax=Labrys monachus TaxID=217067 RepID=A0ABU0F7Z0_9HYPH|nr:prepilin peptidase [Labrys monachus]MDQ0390695.1 prepilin signal peptidase PulO-like enzyme (type II secretory pathway) [Labrys monachus]